YIGVVHFTSSDAQAALPANATLIGGSGSFSVSLKAAGSQSLTATDTQSPALSASQTGIAVSPAAASTLVVNGFPGAVVAGSTGSVTVTAKDAYGNVATGYSGTIHF